MIEAEQDIIYGSLGDTKSFAVNPIRDTIFLGNNQLYHQTGQIFSIGSSIIAPIGQTGSVVKGLAQFGGGALGAWGGGEVGYHGAKLLGASDSQANAAKFLSSMAGASAGSSLAGKFSLNKLTTKKMPEQASPYNKEQVLKNLEESRLARNSSRMDDYLRKEYELQGKYFAERIVWKNGRYAYISSEIDKSTGQLTPVRYRSYLKNDGSINWPLHNGFTLKNGKPVMNPANLKIGDIIDRFGESGGTFTSPVEGGKITPFNQRGLPYPEDYQVYHQYKVIQNIDLKNVEKAYQNLPQSDKFILDKLMRDYKFTLEDIANPQKGTIDIVFGSGGGTQVKFGTSVSWYEKLGLIEEIK
ncbi:glycohydrolase toxin TNT-related protein [Streptococcus ruminantium]|uniref:Membrane protein n=1 Tax=Streptococcus ruminantium TaxID=1917441 RepID=A0A2Z5TND5_9STRE|nr:membrane protein [Streptococcus ruminantium]